MIITGNVGSNVSGSGTETGTGSGTSSMFGSPNNLFGASSGDITASPSTVQPADTRIIAETTRDEYFIANPDNLIEYNDNFHLAIRIIYKTGNGDEVVYNNQHRHGDIWINDSDITGTDFSNISPDHIPSIDENGQPYDSGIIVDVDSFDFGESSIICKSIQVDPSESVDVGPARSLRERGGYGESHSNVTGKDYITLDYEIDDIGSKLPTYDARSTKELRVVTHADDNVIMTNVSNYILTPEHSNDVHAIYLKLANDVTNFRLQIVSNVTGKPIHYYPSELIWRKHDTYKGMDFAAGEIKLDLSSALAEIGNVEITVNIAADEPINLLGDGTHPWRAVDRQLINPVNVATESYVQSVTMNLLSPTWGAVNSNDANIIYGGFKQTGRIRRRELDTGTDTWIESTISLPVPTESAWADWQNRESLIYVEEI